MKELTPPLPRLNVFGFVAKCDGKNNKRTRFVLSAIFLCMFALYVYQFDFSFRGGPSGSKLNVKVEATFLRNDRQIGVKEVTGQK